jgi:ribulose-phosphate 3-epimerase
MKKLSASILSADFGHLAEQVHLAEEAGVDWIHVDVMDGHFVPNITIGPDVTRALKKATKLPLDVHLMISNPERYVKDFVDAGADWLAIHVEATVHLERLIQNIKELGAKAAVTLNPATPLDQLEYVLSEVDMVLLMTVNPGFSGQKFIRGVLPKIRRLRQMIDERKLPALIEVDGGVSTQTVGDIVAAGADVLVSGSGIFGKGPESENDEAERIAANVRRLRELML